MLRPFRSSLDKVVLFWSNANFLLVLMKPCNCAHFLLFPLSLLVEFTPNFTFSFNFCSKQFGLILLSLCLPLSSFSEGLRQFFSPPQFVKQSPLSSFILPFLFLSLLLTQSSLSLTLSSYLIIFFVLFDSSYHSCKHPSSLEVG